MSHKLRIRTTVSRLSPKSTITMVTYSRAFALIAAFTIRSAPFWVDSQPSDMPSGEGGAINECTGPTSCDDGSCGSCKTIRDDVPGCSCSGCECVVCAEDPFCCVKEWDHICVRRAEDLCDCVVFPTVAPTASPTTSPAPTYEPRPFNMFFTVAGSYRISTTSGVYAANTEGLGGPPNLLYPLDRPLSGITATSCTLRRLYWATEEGAIMYGSIDGAETPTTLYEYLDAGPIGSVGGILCIAVNEDLGVILLGSYSGLFMAALDGTSNQATMLDGPDIYTAENSVIASAVAVDPTSGYLYYGGQRYSKENKGFVSLFIPPYTESPRVLYTPPFFDMYDYEGQPQDIAIDVSGNILFFVEKNNVYWALLDGTSPQAEILYLENYFMNETVRTVEYYMGELYIGVYDYIGNSKIYKANADGSGEPTVIYDLPSSNPMDYLYGIRGITVASCPSPTESPTPCNTESKTSQVYPLSTTSIADGILTVPFVLHLGWEVAEIESITIDIEKRRTNGGWRDYAIGLEVDIASGVDGVFVLVQDVAESGVYRWMATVATSNACLTEDVTGWEQFSLS